MSYARSATHSGSWYSDDPTLLGEQLSSFLTAAAAARAASSPADTPSPHTLRGLVVPHAGLRYSGATAAHAYTHLEAHLSTGDSPIKHILVLGPSHHARINSATGLAVSTAARCITPLGDLRSSPDLTARLVSAGVAALHQSVDEAEHSCEMQYCYLARAVAGRDITVSSVLVGACTPQGVAALAPILRDPEFCIVVSTDFCHFGSRFDYTPDALVAPHRLTVSSRIQALDRKGMAAIALLDGGDAFSSYLKETRNTICGRSPLQLLLAALGEGAHGHVLEWCWYAQSGEIGVWGGGESSVSYAAGRLMARVG